MKAEYTSTWSELNQVGVRDEMLADSQSHYWVQCRKFVLLLTHQAGVRANHFSAYYDDIVQEVMVTVAARLDHCRVNMSLTAWLKRIVAVKMMDIQRNIHKSEQRPEVSCHIAEGTRRDTASDQQIKTAGSSIFSNITIDGRTGFWAGGKDYLVRLKKFHLLSIWKNGYSLVSGISNFHRGKDSLGEPIGGAITFQ